MNPVRSWFAPLVVLSLALGCGSSGSTSPDATGAAGNGAAGSGAAGSDGTAGTGSAGSGAAGTASACNAIVNSAPAVHPEAAGGPGMASPIPAGGTIVDGTYFLTKYENYKGAASTATYHTVLVFQGATIQLEQTLDADETRATLSLMATGTSFKAFYTCGPELAIGAQLAYDQYTASPTQILLFGKDRVLTLTLQ
jgi:hypothetical protein